MSVRTLARRTHQRSAALVPGCGTRLAAAGPHSEPACGLPAAPALRLVSPPAAEPFPAVHLPASGSLPALDAVTYGKRVSKSSMRPRIQRQCGPCADSLPRHRQRRESPVLAAPSACFLAPALVPLSRTKPPERPEPKSPHNARRGTSGPVVLRRCRPETRLRTSRNLP